MRGAGDLPVLVLAGDLAAAVADLSGDLADALVDAGDPVSGEGGLKGLKGAVPLADRSVAVLNRGTPGCVVTPDGTLRMSLLRSARAGRPGCGSTATAAPRRTGGGFAWQHWSHTFGYALASAVTAPTRAPRATALAAEDYNHDLLATVTAAGEPGGFDGSAQAGGPSVDGAPNVTLAALKPVGNPLAAGRPGTLAAGRATLPSGCGRPTDDRSSRGCDSPAWPPRGSPICSRSPTALRCGWRTTRYLSICRLSAR